VDILISRPAEGLNSDFLAAWINSSFGKEQVLRKQGGLAQQHFNVGELRELVVALPEPEEQERIVTRLQAVNSRVQLEASMAKKYQAIKAGLMQDLLTGRIPVVAESSTEPREVAANV
jgi:type I restriction enzyme S subunit